jgi:septal ring factor EnvC (AmiA/AmiB activator)
MQPQSSTDALVNPDTTPAVDTTDTASVGSTPAATQTKRAKKQVLLHPRTQKRIDALNTKIDKQANQIKALQKQLSDFKTSHSRIRRIPKPTATLPEPVEN